MLRLLPALILTIFAPCLMAQSQGETVVQGSAGWGHASTTGKTEGRGLYESGTEPWDPNQTSKFAAKKFENSADLNLSKSQMGQGSYAVNAVNPSGAYKETREFFGLKNPWFGKKVFVTDPAALLSKSFVTDANEKFAVDAAQTKDFYQAGKSAAGQSTEIPVRAATTEGKAQGMLDKVSSDKNLTIDQVRDLLNKN